MATTNIDNRRRGTIIEEAAVGLLEGKELAEKQLLKKKKSPLQRLKSLGGSIYNSEYREFAGRDAEAWFQLSVFYATFYFFLGCFFLFTLYMFSLTLDYKKPTYYDKTSVMNHGGGITPGLGFRPQYNPENDLIEFDTPTEKNKILKSLKVFLDNYEEKKDEVVIMSDITNRTASFNYHDIIDGTPCAVEKNYGYDTTAPCIILKINRIYGWKPVPFDVPPKELNIDLTEQQVKIANETKFLYISCEGEEPFDKDNIGDVKYYSLFPSNEIGGIPINYFPYRNQDNYLSPLVFVHFESLVPQTLVKVKCLLWGKNVDNTDEYNLKGMAKFELFIGRL